MCTVGFEYITGQGYTKGIDRVAPIQGRDIMPQSRVCKCCQRDGDPSHLKDSAWAWMVCFGAATNMAFTTGLIFCFGVLLPVFMDYFKESRQRVGKVFSSTQGQGQSRCCFVINHSGKCQRGTALLINLAVSSQPERQNTIYLCAIVF